ncbi:hypothetical protein BGZ97_006596, partial [Linnemannia gamsii]
HWIDSPGPYPWHRICLVHHLQEQRRPQSEPPPRTHLCRRAPATISTTAAAASALPSDCASQL